MSEGKTYSKDVRIDWYRTPVEKPVMTELLKRSDRKGLQQSLGHLGLWAVTGTLAYAVFLRMTAANAWWSVPLLLGALFAHGTVGSFFGGTACHELCHTTPFKSKALNAFFLRVFAFFGWWDQVWFQPSHMRHHQATVHHDYDGEVVLPQRLSFKDWRFWLGLFAWNPLNTWNVLKAYGRRARGQLDNEWFAFIMPEENLELRRRHRNWARFTLAGHALLAAVFILSGHWFLIFIVNLGTQYCGWLGYLMGTPQHYGLSPNVSDHRLSCRTFTCSWLPAFLYWNMQYHIDHHMFPAVPFFNLPKLHRLIRDDLPPVPHGLRATWQGMLAIHRRMLTDPDYCYVPPLPTRPSRAA